MPIRTQAKQSFQRAAAPGPGSLHRRVVRPRCLLLIRLFQQAAMGRVCRMSGQCKPKISPRQKPYRWA